MLIYKAEREVKGLEDQVKANRSLSYLTKVVACSQQELQRIDMAQAHKSTPSMATASIADEDLYFTKSIYVSTNWNLNDDVFTKIPVWAARHTPEHKRTNLEHDENQLVGHITSSWAINLAGELIPDDSVIDDVPDFFHIVNGAVIYKLWKDKELTARATNLIAEIEAGTKFVSMEAMFDNFDYAIITPDDKPYVIARKSDTAFLTKYLRIYGGSGEFEGCKIGRLLQNLVFCGKGYVDNPGNPYSVILQGNETAAMSHNFTAATIQMPFNKQSGVLTSCSSNTINITENTLMPDTETSLLKSQNDELKAAVAKLQEETKTLSVASANTSIKTLEVTVAQLQEAAATAKTTNDDLAAKLVAANKSLDDTVAQLAEAQTVKATLEAQVAKAKAESVQAVRIGQLVEGGFTTEDATAKVVLFSEFNDAQFNAVAVELIEAKKTNPFAKKKDKNGKDMPPDEGETCATVDAAGEAAATAAASLVVEASTDVIVVPAVVTASEAAISLREELGRALAHRLGLKDPTETEDTTEVVV